MALNLSNVFSKTNTIINNLLSVYVSVQLIGFNQSNDNRPYYLLDSPITKGFKYSTKKLPVTGQVVETLKLVPETDDINQLFATNKVKMVELTDANGNFLRFSIQTVKEPYPPEFQWVFNIEPNKQEKTVIT